MLQETRLFSTADRLIVPRDLIDNCCREMAIKDNYGDDLFSGYFADYAGVAAKFRPQTIFEIGVRYGYTAICMLWGIKETEKNDAFLREVVYRGIDDESYHPCLMGANQNFARQVPWADAHAMYYNSITQGVPPEMRIAGHWNLIHIDGNHDYLGVANDLERTWELLSDGGIIVLDDCKLVDENPIPRAIADFLKKVDRPDLRIEYQWHENERWHCYIRKSKLKEA